MSAPDASVLHGKISSAQGILLPRTEPRFKTMPVPTRPTLMGRLFRRAEPTMFQRCLAVHIHYASQNGGMH